LGTFEKDKASDPNMREHKCKTNLQATKKTRSNYGLKRKAWQAAQKMVICKEENTENKEARPA